MSGLQDLTPADFLASWLPENGGLCQVCNAAAPIAVPLSCPTGCDLSKPFRTWRDLESVRLQGVLARRDDAPPAPLRPPLPRVRSLTELYDDAAIMAPATMVIPGLVEAGTGTLLVAPPKTGKSQLITQLAADFSAGRPALDGTPMGPGKVLWIATDEPMRRLVPRFFSLHADPENIWIVARESDRITPERFAALLEAEQPALVVIDTLSQLASDNCVKPNDAESVVPFMKALLDAVQSRPGCGAVFIAHAPHHAARASGSTQWAAIPDAVLVLRRPVARTLRPGESPDDQGDASVSEDGRRILEGVARWGGDQRTQLSFRDGRYTLGVAEAPLIDRIRWLMKQTEPGPERTSQAEITRRVRARSEAVSAVVHLLIDRRELKQIGSGRKRYLAPTASLSLYAGRAAEVMGNAGESMPEEKEIAEDPFPSRVQTRVRANGKRKDSAAQLPADLLDPGYFDALAQSAPVPDFDAAEALYGDAE